MKVEIIKDDEVKYPRLMIHKLDLNVPNPMIILFANDSIGIVVSVSDDDLVIVRNSEKKGDMEYDINEFVPFVGQIILTQE